MFCLVLRCTSVADGASNLVGEVGDVLFGLTVH